MSRLPVVVGFGGVNAAGRSSFHQGYRRLVLNALDTATQQHTLAGIGRLMRLVGSDNDADFALQHGSTIHQHTLIRRIEPHYFDVNAMPLHHALPLHTGSPLQLRLRTRDLPPQIPSNWSVQTLSDTEVSVSIPSGLNVLLPSAIASAVTSAGQVPSGFNPGAHYASHHHPRALQLTVFGASDALHSLGIPWEVLRQQLAPDRVAVYAASAHGQLDDLGAGGMMKAPWQGHRHSAKQCPLGFAEMPADFINAYILGSVGRTAGILGACATFLYNLERAVTDIRDGRVDFAIVGAAEAPILPEVIEGYRAMGALGEDAKLLELDRARGLTHIDHTRATRPFGYNAGFTMAESAQFLVLTSDDFALQQGLPIHASVPGVFVHADGYKKSISAPGVGNYYSFGKAVALGRELLGDKALRTRTYVQAHGTGTPQNRVTESQIFDEVAQAFGIQNWLVSSIKCYVGHSLGAAAGDQFMAALGVWNDGIVPGIFTLDEIAHDVHQKNLHFSQAHIECGTKAMTGCFINAKGFGGNNATALVLSPEQTQAMLLSKHGEHRMTAWRAQTNLSHAQRLHYQEQSQRGIYQSIYRFGGAVLTAQDLTLSTEQIALPNSPPVPLSSAQHYAAYQESSTAEKT